MTEDQIRAVMVLADAMARAEAKRYFEEDQGWSEMRLATCTVHASAKRIALESALRDALGSKRADTERLNWIARQYLPDLTMHLVVDAQYDGQYYVCGDSNKPGYGPTLRAAIDAAMSGLGVGVKP